MRKSANSKISVEPGRTGIYIVRKKQFQSVMMPERVMINDLKAGQADSGFEKFFDVPAGLVTVSIGQGKTKSEPIQFNIRQGQQLFVDAEIVSQGLKAKQIMRLRR